MKFEPLFIRSQAERFSRPLFKERIRQYVDEKLRLRGMTSQ
jgi:hypothetical protein